MAGFGRIKQNSMCRDCNEFCCASVQTSFMAAITSFNFH